jgi:predicted GNAT family N-acyltransferase
MSLSIKKALSDEDISQCMAIRFKVFVEGQNVPMQEEVDGKDAEASHYLLLIDFHPAGVARVRCMDHYFKIERVGIIAEYQGKGLGRDIMRFILSDLKALRTSNKVKLSSQTHAIPFYEKLGFSVCSDEYMDAGIRHKDMQLTF